MRSISSRIIAGFVVSILLLASGLLVTGCGDDPAVEVLEALETISVKTFSKTFGGAGYESARSVQQTADGGYIVAGTTDNYVNGDAWLVKTDASGNLVWQKTFGGAGGDSALSVQQTSDGGYILAGYYSDDTEDLDDPYTQAYLVKTDGNGNLVWQKILGGAFYYATSVQEIGGGGYILAGQSNYAADEPDGEAWLAKTDAAGDLIWIKEFKSETPGFSGANSVLQASDGGFVVVGDTSVDMYGGRKAWLAKTDSSGNLAWQKAIGEVKSCVAYSVQQTTDGGYILAGYYGTGYPYYDQRAYLVKTDSSGNLVWQKNFGDPLSDGFTSVRQTSDGGYILAGKSGTGGSAVDAYLVKTDASGNILWEKTFSNADDYDGFISVQQTKDGGFVMAGTTGGTYKDSDVYLVKTDAAGNCYTGGAELEEPVPVVLVHGINAKGSDWDSMVEALEDHGMVKWNEGDGITNKSILVFDYESHNKADQRKIAAGVHDGLFGMGDYDGLDDFIDDNLGGPGGWITEGGQIDIICHSMGSLVTRWWMEELDNGNNAAHVRQWIGVAPTSHGSATADHICDSGLGGYGEAVVQLQTKSDTVATLDADGIQEGLDAGVKYHVIVGVNTSKDEDFCADDMLLNHVLLLDLKGRTLDRQTAFDDDGKPYEYNAKVYLGDSYVSMNQSMLAGATNEYFDGRDHSEIIRDLLVCETVWDYLINPSETTVWHNCDELLSGGGGGTGGW